MPGKTVMCKEIKDNLRSTHDNSAFDEVKIQFADEVVWICDDIISVRISVGPIWEGGGAGCEWGGKRV